MTYPATNLRLEFNNDTGEWSYVEQAYEYTSPPPPTWSGYTSTDPDFPTAPPDDNGDDEEEPECPVGYIYDTELKQCVPDPDYNPRAWMGEPQGGGGDNQPETNFIPSNQEKEKMIAEGDTKGYIDNLKKRGFVKVGDDGKLYFKKDNLGSSLASAALSKIGMGGEPSAKTNKIIQDLQRMGAIDASNITVTGYEKDGTPIIDYASDLEISETPGTFPTYNYNAGTAETGWVPGTFTGFTTPASHPLGVTTISSGDGFDTWTNYINALMSSNVTSTGKKEITSVTGKTLDQIQNEIAEAKLQKAKADADKATAEANNVINDISKDGGSTTSDDNVIGEHTTSDGIKVKLKKKPPQPKPQPQTGTQQNQPGSVPNPHTTTGFSGGQSYGTSHAVGSANPHGNNEPPKSKYTFKGK